MAPSGNSTRYIWLLAASPQVKNLKENQIQNKLIVRLLKCLTCSVTFVALEIVVALFHDGNGEDKHERGDVSEEKSDLLTQDEQRRHGEKRECEKTEAKTRRRNERAGVRFGDLEGRNELAERHEEKVKVGEGFKLLDDEIVHVCGVRRIEIRVPVAAPVR